MNFFKRVLSTVTGIFVFFGICVVLLIVLGLIFGSSSEEVVHVKSNSILELKLDFPINDYAGKTEFKDYPFLNEEEKNGLFNIIDAIKYAETDDKIKGISIDNNFIDAGISQIKALRDALLEFKKSGKFIMAYADIYFQKDYYLSSVADTIYLNPVGGLEFKGLYSEQLYFKDFQENTGLKMEVVRFGKYKSAVEPFLANEMSDENREQITELLNSIWTEIKKEISESRGVSTENLNNIADSLLTRNATLAKKSKLIDKIGYYDEYVAGLQKAIGISSDKKLETITIEDYALYASNKLKTKTNSKDKIAVIYAEGEIIYGEGEKGYVGQGTMSVSLQKAREDKNVKAIVLRINSPGGSALAGELIWREIELTKKIKPVIVSMGNMATSGGYYIACNANTIFAENNTITGSIGVFGILPNFSKLTTKIGINAQQVKTHENSARYSPFVPLDDKFKEVTLEGVEHIYKTFVTHVAEGRKMTFAQVDSIAQGRVWTGSEALKIGLVDKIGGLNDAIKEAASIAKVKKYSTRNYPEYEKDLNDLFANLPFGQSKESFIKQELGEENYKVLQGIKRMQSQKGVQTMMPFEINIQ